MIQDEDSYRFRFVINYVSNTSTGNQHRAGTPIQILDVHIDVVSVSIMELGEKKCSSSVSDTLSLSKWV